jgi:hypothetical protein
VIISPRRFGDRRIHMKGGEEEEEYKCKVAKSTKGIKSKG